MLKAEFRILTPSRYCKNIEHTSEVSSFNRTDDVPWPEICKGAVQSKLAAKAAFGARIAIWSIERHQGIIIENDLYGYHVQAAESGANLVVKAEKEAGAEADAVVTTDRGDSRTHICGVGTYGIPIPSA